MTVISLSLINQNDYTLPADTVCLYFPDSNIKRVIKSGNLSGKKVAKLLRIFEYSVRPPGYDWLRISRSTAFIIATRSRNGSRLVAGPNLLTFTDAKILVIFC